MADEQTKGAEVTNVVTEPSRADLDRAAWRSAGKFILALFVGAGATAAIFAGLSFL